jgi:hypothetical protein
MTWVMTRFTGLSTILAILVLICGFVQAHTDSVPKEGDPAPAFSITSDHGKRTGVTIAVYSN